MIRLCGSDQLCSFLGYEHETQASAALELTRANCGGIHAEWEDGHVTCSTNAHPTSQALAVALPQGESERIIEEAIMQINACRKFEVEKEEKDCEKGVGVAYWCFRLTTSVPDSDTADFVAVILQRILGVECIAPAIFRQQLVNERTNGTQSMKEHSQGPTQDSLNTHNSEPLSTSLTDNVHSDKQNQAHRLNTESSAQTLPTEQIFEVDEDDANATKPGSSMNSQMPHGPLQNRFIEPTQNLLGRPCLRKADLKWLLMISTYFPPKI